MIKNEAYKNRKVATASGNVHFNEKGHGKGETARAEELLARLAGFDLVAEATVEEAPEKAEEAPVEEAPKKASAKKAPAKKSPAKKAPEKEEAPAEEEAK